MKDRGMANFFMHLRRLETPVSPAQLLALFVIVWLPIIGSRSIGANVRSDVRHVAVEDVVSLSPFDIHEKNNTPHLTNDTMSESVGGGEDDANDVSVEKGDKVTSQLSLGAETVTPCAFLESDLSRKLVSFQEKSLITVSHHAFDVSYGIVPNILYAVELEVPTGSRFSLEYWGNGLSDERSRTKRRHQRDRDIFELFANDPSTTVPETESVVVCSKSSLVGENKDTSPLILSFTWYINTNSIAPFPTNGLPSNIVFRLRFTSIVDSTSNVFEQNLSILVRPDCFLVMKIYAKAKLSMESIWSPQSPIENKGLNCTVLFIPRTNFGLEIRIANLSIYGMRDICKGRYLTFSRTIQTQKPNPDYSALSASELQNDPIHTSFPTYSYKLSPLDRKFCGKLEDYSRDERILTFKSNSEPQFRTQTKLTYSKPVLFSYHPYSTKSESDNDNADTKLNNNSLNSSPDGFLLRVSFPVAVKSKETFCLDINSLNPCERVVLKDLDGGLNYSKSYTPGAHQRQDTDECSIVIHVPYGNRIITSMTLTRVRDGKDELYPGERDFEPDEEVESESDTIANPISNANNFNNSFNYDSLSNNNYNESSSGMDVDSKPEEASHSSMLPIPRTKSYECPSNFASSTTSSDSDDDNNYPMFTLVRADDIDSGSKFTWCFDGSSNSHAQHKRAWKSTGNKVKISFELKYFNVFHLTYHSVKVDELVGDCDPGWVTLNGRCVLLVESGSSWPSAEESCQLTGGHLATIENEDEEHKFQKIITESALFHPSQAYWIGANDRDLEGNFQWTSGLSFSYNNWFMGWTHRHNDISNAQPNDDGWSGQDCVEIRQVLNPSISYSGKPLSSQFWDEDFLQSKTKPGTNHKNEVHSNIWPHTRFFWNDRNCEAKNFYICEKTTHHEDYGTDYLCNRSLQLSPNQEITVTSPGYPGYPDNRVCLTMIETVPEYIIFLSFDEFVLEESSPSCQYDALIIKEIYHGSGSTSPFENHSQINASRRICGDWTKRLKLLRYKTTSSTSSLSLTFESDFSHHFAGFKARVWTERDVSGQCSDQQMKKFKSYCYLGVNYPAVNWATAQQVCASLQGKLASVVSMDEWKFLTQSLPSTSRYDKKSTFWIGGSIDDRSSQLVWSDRMPFNFSAFHSSDLQTISDWKCLRVYWHEWGKGDFAWRLADCNQLSGYVCKKMIFEGETRQVVNKTFSGIRGKQISPNYPNNYPNNLDYGYHLIAPRGTKIVIRFSHLDVEDQEDCLYDYVEIVDKNTNNSTRYCGMYAVPDLERLDYVSSSNEVDVLFHTDFSNSGTGFEITWRAIDVASCLSGKTILADLGGNGFPIQDVMIHSPNFPHFNLPSLNCIYTIVAPVGQRIWLNFQIFEIGQPTTFETDCHLQDHVIVDLDGEIHDKDEADSSTENEIILCGNLTSASYRTSFISVGEKIRIRIISPNGKSGRGFLGKLKAVPSLLVETLNVAMVANSSVSLTSINFPLIPPENTNVTLAFSSPPNYVLAVHINGTSSCPKTAKSYLEIRDPYLGANGTTWKLCHQTELATWDALGPKPGSMRDGLHLVNSNENGDGNVNNKMGHNEISQGITQMKNTTISFRSTFNRLDIRQVYSPGFRKPWNARLVTTLDENFRAKVLADGDRLLKLDGCMNSPCANGGSCISENGKHICRCSAPFTGPFCGLNLCDLNPCLFGDCILGVDRIKCACILGYGGERCDRRMKPCDDNPCSGHGACLEVNKTAYRCMCHAWWEGPQCESRMLVIPFKPLSQRVFEEPFWLGLITVSVVLGVIGLIWCLKRHFPEKLEKLLNEDLDKSRGISWVSSGRSPSFRAGGGGGSLGIRDPIPGTSQQAASPPTSRSFLGRFGIRKPSLLSLSSATSVMSGAAVSPHSYENRTFSLDDLLRPSRSMMRTPSPHRRRNYSVQVRRDPAEKQQILQQLVSAGVSTSLDGESKPSTPKPTLAEIIQMSEKRLRLASASSMQSEAGSIGSGEASTSRQGEEETSFTVNPNLFPAASKAEKKVTFARMLDKLAASEMTSSSSCSDVSCAEDTKMVVVAPKPVSKKDRKGRFRRSNKSYNRGRNSETDQDYMDISSSDTTPDPIYTPKLPTRLCISPTGLGTSTSSGNSLGKPNQKIPKIASADSLLALFRRFSGSNSAPPSPQYSENEESSAGATPLSTPSSPRSSLLSIRPPALMISAVPEPNTTIELPVIDPFSQNQGWRTPSASSITLEVPMRDYCLSPIHEVPTPLGTPSHTPCHTPMMKRMSADENLPSIKILMSSEEDNTNRTSSFRNSSPPLLKRFRIPVISISVDDTDEGNVIDIGDSEQGKEDDMKTKQLFHNIITGESEVIPDVLIHVPPDACVESQPESESPIRDAETPINSPRVKNKPPPLIFANEILSCNKDPGDDERNVKIIVPVVNIEYATPVSEHMPQFPCIKGETFYQPRFKTLPEMIPSIIFEHSGSIAKESPLVPPTITINQSSEAESDSDTPAQRHMLRPNLCFLSPFAGASDRIPSESNLSTSGYSSMASPCPSRCPSVSPLCPSEPEEYHTCCHYHNQRRASLTPGTPKKLPFAPRRSSFNAPHVTSGLCDNSDKFCEDEVDGSRTKEHIEIETDSAVEVETDLDCTITLSEIENPPSMSIRDQKSIATILSEDMKFINTLLQVPKKGLPKSRSLDIGVSVSHQGSGQYSPEDVNSIPDGRKFDKKGQLLLGHGPSLDSKLNTIYPNSGPTTGVKIIFPLSTSSSTFSGRKNVGNFIEIPEEKERRLSPVSSRSESPLSELSATGCFGFMGSPLTDSDGVYDCGGSSEVLTNNNETDTATGSRICFPPLNQENLKKRPGGKKKERKVIRGKNKLSFHQACAKSTAHQDFGAAGVSAAAASSQHFIDGLGKQVFHLDLPPNLAIDFPASTVSTKRGSLKRRMRAQPTMDASSSSSESLASTKSRPRSRTSWSSVQNSRNTSRNNSPLPANNDQEDGNNKQPLITTNSPGVLSQSLDENVAIRTSMGNEKPMQGSLDAGVSLSPHICISATPGRKISRLRTISNQIRFLRRLELSLIRKKECLTHISKSTFEDRRENICVKSDSTEGSSRCDTSDTSSTCSDSCSECCNSDLHDNEKPLLAPSSSGAWNSEKKRREKITPLNLLENISARDFLDFHKNRIRKYK